MENMLEMLLMLMLGGTGVYALYSVIRLRHEMYLFPNRFLYPSNCRPEDCTDVDGFIDFITPRLFLFGGACLAVTVVMVLSWVFHLFTMPAWLDTYGIAAIGLLCFVYYIVVQNKVYKRFW